VALVAFLRGVNVGGHRAFRPSVLAKQLARYEMVNIGATGTFVIPPHYQDKTTGRAGAQAAFRYSRHDLRRP
jgi:hypothetical protein